MQNLENNYDYFDFSGQVSPPKETTTSAKERTNLIVEVKAKTYYSLQMMSRKFLEYRQVESILM